MLKRSMPWLLAASERLLPLARLTPAFVQQRVLERSLNHLLAEALADGLFEILTDRWLALEIQDLGLRWCISQRGLDQQLVIAQQAPVEVCISGQWRDFLLLASRQEDPDSLFFRRRLQIDGDTELGLAVKNLIDSLDPDSLPQWFWQLLELLGRTVAEQQAQVMPSPSS